MRPTPLVCPFSKEQIAAAPRAENPPPDDNSNGDGIRCRIVVSLRETLNTSIPPNNAPEALSANARCGMFGIVDLVDPPPVTITKPTVLTKPANRQDYNFSSRIFTISVLQKKKNVVNEAKFQI